MEYGIRLSLDKTDKMKKFLFLAILIIGSASSFVSLDNVIKTPQKPTILEKVANANGFQNWKNVKELKFTFNVDRDTSHFERTWIWKPKTNDITSIAQGKTLNYNWSNMDSTAYKANAGFINDKYWLLTPFQLIWDSKNITYEHISKADAPMSKQHMQKLTITYGNKGGYTPGDAYDFYFGDDFIIKEWVYRKSNQAEPSMITTWEDYVDKGGLKIAQTHKKGDGSFKLYFTDIEVKTN